MNKYLMMSATAFFATTVAASADDGKKSNSGSATVMFGSSCDYYDLHWQGAVYVAEHVYTACGSNYVFPELGIGGKTKGLGNNVNFSDPSFYIIYGENYAAGLDLSTPIKNGGTWELWVAFNQSSAILANEGTYQVGHDVKLGSHTSTISGVVEKLKERGIESNSSK